jgi:hypothetical protein
VPSRLIRLMFTVTSLAPVLITYAALFVFDGGPRFELDLNKLWAAICLLVVVASVYVCHRILRFYSTKVGSGPLRITSLRVADRSTITFVVVYVLPLLTVGKVQIQMEVLVIVFGLLIMLIYHSDAYLVNPLLAIPFKYHFYEVTNEEQVTYILVSRREIVNTREPIEGRQVSKFMFLDAEGQGD